MYGNTAETSQPLRMKTEITITAVILISVLMGALVAGIIETQMTSYYRMINEKPEN